MKRLIAAVSFSLLAAPALAEVGLPYDQLAIDRALPNLQVERTRGAEAARSTTTVTACGSSDR